MRRAYVSDGLVYTGLLALVLALSLIALGALGSMSCSQFGQTVYCYNALAVEAFFGWMIGIVAVVVLGLGILRQPKMTCPKCGREIFGEVAYCPSCGAALHS
jgi:hypothetical protein